MFLKCWLKPLLISVGDVCNLFRYLRVIEGSLLDFVPLSRTSFIMDQIFLLSLSAALSFQL
jgi:hypothetical protein